MVDSPIDLRKHFVGQARYASNNCEVTTCFLLLKNVSDNVVIAYHLKENLHLRQTVTSCRKSVKFLAIRWSLLRIAFR